MTQEGRWYVLSLQPTLPETNSSPLKMDGWNTSFFLGWPIFRGEMLVLGSVYFEHISSHTKELTLLYPEVAG